MRPTGESRNDSVCQLDRSFAKHGDGFESACFLMGRRLLCRGGGGDAGSVRSTQDDPHARYHLAWLERHKLDIRVPCRLRS